VQGVGYIELVVERDMTAHKLETNTTALELETKIDVSKEILKQERYSTD
jgi:hypothetical protein